MGVILFQKIAFRVLLIVSITLTLAFTVHGGSSTEVKPSKSVAAPRTDLMRQAYASALEQAAQQEIDRQVAAYFAAEQERIAREEAAARAAAPPKPTYRPNTGTSTGTVSTGDPGACVRAHESDTAGGYSAVNPNGHYGAYQFSQSTWDNVMRALGYTEYVGVPANQAPPAVQDAAFNYLYAGGAGASHWAGSGC